MNTAVERKVIRWLHLILSIPILGYIYGPVAEIPQARMFTQIVVVPLLMVSGIWALASASTQSAVPPQGFKLSSLHDGELSAPAN